jgi:CBS domain-containing protein
MVMLVRDVMTRGVEFVDPHATVQDAAVRMAEQDIGAVLVGSAERPEGVLTDRDILLRLVVTGGDPVRTRVREIMSTTLFTCSAEASLDDALAEMRERQVRRLPVVGERGEVVGIVVRSELLDAALAPPAGTAEQPAG